MVNLRTYNFKLSIALKQSVQSCFIMISALKVTMNIDQDDYIETGNEAAGARIVIHDQADMPYPEDVGILAKTGMLTSIHVSRVRGEN